MSCEHLICAHCASPVVEARCPSCRAARAQAHHASGLSLPLTAAALLALVLVLLILQLTH